MIGNSITSNLKLDYLIQGHNVVPFSCALSSLACPTSSHSSTKQLSVVALCNAHWVGSSIYIIINVWNSISAKTALVQSSLHLKRKSRCSDKRDSSFINPAAQQLGADYPIHGISMMELWEQWYLADLVYARLEAYSKSVWLEVYSKQCVMFKPIMLGIQHFELDEGEKKGYQGGYTSSISNSVWQSRQNKRSKAVGIPLVWALRTTQYQWSAQMTTTHTNRAEKHLVMLWAPQIRNQRWLQLLSRAHVAYCNSGSAVHCPSKVTNPKV